MRWFRVSSPEEEALNPLTMLKIRYFPMEVSLFITLLPTLGTGRLVNATHVSHHSRPTFPQVCVISGRT